MSARSSDAGGRNIVLTGMMGSGKSTVGRIVAGLTNRELVDTDHRIEDLVGQSIPDIFAAQGEPFFREREREVVADVAQLRDCIISLGGGVVMDPRNVRALKATGVIVFVDAPLSQLVKRLARSSKPGKRPLLDGERDPEKLHQKLSALRDERHDVYVRAADYVLDTRGRGSEDVAREVYEWARVTPGVLRAQELT